MHADVDCPGRSPTDAIGDRIFYWRMVGAEKAKEETALGIYQ